MNWLSFFKDQRLAVDLGNSNTLITTPDQLLVAQPSCLVVNDANNHVEAVGEHALKMMEKTPGLLRPVRPLKGGVIADGDSTRKLLKGLVHMAQGNRWRRGCRYLISGVPFDSTNVEKRALREALQPFGASRTWLVDEPLAAAIGIGLDIRQPEGKMLVDIGGGITEIVIISLSGIAASQSLKLAGDNIDDDIATFLRKQYNLSIGLRTAEWIKRSLGSVALSPDNHSLPVKGKHIMTGLPSVQTVTASEIRAVLLPTFTRIERAILQTLEKCPPELAADVYRNGIHVTGGNALLGGIQARWQKQFGVPIHIDRDPLLAVSKGVSHLLTQPDRYKSILME